MANLSSILAREVPGTRAQADSPQWFIERAAKITGSGLNNICKKPHARNPGQWTMPNPNWKARYYQEKISELLCGKCFEITENEAIIHGKKYEAEALEIANKKYGLTIQQVGALSPVGDEPWMDRFRISPDGIVTAGPDIDPEDLPPCEAKCPGKRNHVKFLESNKVPPDYYAQVQAEIYVADASYGLFFSYHPDMPKEYCMHMIRVPRDDWFIDSEMIPTIKGFQRKLDKGIDKIKDNLDICPV